MKRNYSYYLCGFKQILVVVMFFCSFSVVAQQKVKSDDVPQAVKTTFQQEFPNAKVKEWQVKDDQYSVSYKDDGTQQTSVFLATGSLIETRTPISKKELPDFIMQYMAGEYPGFDVNSCFLVQKPKTKDSYFVEVKKSGMGTGGNSELTFTSDGKLLLRKDPDGFVAVKKEEPQKKEVVKNEKAPRKAAVNDSDEEKTVKKANQSSKVKEKAAKNPNAEPEETKTKSKNKKDHYPENIISENNVPAIVKKNFAKKFPKAEEVKWFNKQGDTVYTIKCFFREQENEIKYTASGKWISQKTELGEKMVFPAVQKYLDKTYRKYQLVTCVKTVTPDKKDGGFEVKIIELKYKKKKIETTILFDKMGKLVKTIDPDVAYEEEEAENESSTDRKFDSEYNKASANNDSEVQSGTKVSKKELPSDITAYVSANYPGMIIKSAYLREIDDLGMCYDLSITRDGINQEVIELVFDKSGKFLKNMNTEGDGASGNGAKKNIAVAYTPAEAVVNGFKTKHPKVVKVTWEEGSENDFVASFSDGTGAHKSYFNADGTWIKISTVMNVESVSPGIKTYVDKNYKGYKIMAARNIKKADKKTYYEVDIQHKKTSDTQTLEFTQAGKPTNSGNKE